MTCGKNWRWPTHVCMTSRQHWDYTSTKRQFKTQVNSSCIFSILIVLIAEAFFVLGELFYYCLCFILACLSGGTCYILMLIVEAAKSCKFLLFRSTPSVLVHAKELYELDLCYCTMSSLFYLLAPTSEPLSSPAVPRLDPQMECENIIEMQQLEILYLRDQIQEKGQSLNCPGSVSLGQKSSWTESGKKPQDTATLMWFKDVLCYYILLARSEMQWHRVDLHDPILSH